MTELLVILVIGLLVLGPKRLPELARSLGKGLAEFRRASTDMRREFTDVAEEVRGEPPAEQAPNGAGKPAELPAPESASEATRAPESAAPAEKHTETSGG